MPEMTVVARNGESANHIDQPDQHLAGAVAGDSGAAATTAGQSLNGGQLAHTAEQRKGALQRCEKMIGWYEQQLTRARRAYRLFGTATILLSSITPILILWQPFGPTNLIAQATPAALAALFAALLTNYRWREDWVRYAVAAETLRSEKTKFETRTTQDYALSLPDAVAFDNFVFRMESLAISEVSEWRNQLVQKTNEPKGDS